jgi:hypothetical protein
MTYAVRSISALLAFTLTLTQFAQAARPPRRLAAPQQTSAPTPTETLTPEALAQARLLSAKNIFISNDGADSDFPADPGAGVAHFSAALRSWGRYNVVSSVKQADLVLQLRSASATSVVDDTINGSPSSIYRTPYFRLNIADPATLKPIWSITVPVRTGIRKKDKANFLDVSAQNLTSQLKLLDGDPLSTHETAELQDSTRYSTHRGSYVPLAIFGAAVIGSTVAGILTVRAFHNSEQQQQQDLCKMNPFFCTGP